MLAGYGFALQSSGECWQERRARTESSQKFAAAAAAKRCERIGAVRFPLPAESGRTPESIPQHSNQVRIQHFLHSDR